MKSESKENKRKNMDVDPSDDTLGENTERTPLTEEVEKEEKKKENRNRPKESK